MIPDDRIPPCPGLRALILALLTTLTLSAADYAVVPAPHGDDSGTGKGERPWATLRHALSRAGSGDTIHLRRGSIYRERDLEFKAGVTVRGSGSPELPPPVVTTSLAVPALTPWSENANVLTAKVEQRVLDCSVDGQPLLLARYPNRGWMRTKAGSTPDLIVDPERARVPGAAPGRWNGAQVRWRRWSWWWETRPITNDDGSGRISLGPENRYQDPFTGIGSAWYVDNCLAELDAPGEWHWEDGTLYVYPPAEADPDQPLVEVVVEPTGFKCSGATLDGIAFARIAGTALTIGRPSTITNCTFADIGENAIAGHWDAFGSRIVGCTFTDVHNVAITWGENAAGSGGTLIEGNHFERIGMRFGYGGSGPWHAAGVILQGGNAITMRLNRLIDIGYAGVILGADGQVVERNVFVRCMGSLNDGAAVYANCHRSVIRENIILDTIGNLETSHPWYPLGHGVWPEFLSDFRETVIIGNTVFGSGGHGLFITNNFKNEMRDNVLVGNRLAGLLLEGEPSKGSQDHVMSGNVLVALDPGRRLTQPDENIPGDWISNDRSHALEFKPGIAYGEMTDTTYVVPPGVPVAKSDGQTFQDGAALSAAQPWADPAARTMRGAALLLINDTEQPYDFPAPSGTWADTDGNRVAKTVTVAPFRSAVLVRASDASGLPPYILASGIDYRVPTTRAEPLRIAAKPKAADKPEKSKRAAKPAERPAPTPVAKPDPEAWKRWVLLLRERTAAAAASRKQPQYDSALLRAKVTVVAVDGDQATLRISGGGEMTANLFGRIAASDAAQLARDLLRGDDALGHAMAAFFARCAAESVPYQEHLSRAGEFAAEVEQAFELEQ